MYSLWHSNSLVAATNRHLSWTLQEQGIKSIRPMSSMHKPQRAKASRSKRPTQCRNLHLESLPNELQHQIFSLVLVEVPRWDKLHDSSCDYKPSSVGPLEPPPFLHASINVSRRDDQSWKVQTNANCPCAKRKGIGLLQTSRQIHNMAAPIFWSTNTFCFQIGRAHV